MIFKRGSRKLKKSSFFQDEEDFDEMNEEVLYESSNELDNVMFEDNEETRVYYQDEEWDEIASEPSMISHNQLHEETLMRPKRAKYHAKIDRFLTNGIIIVGVLLFAVLLIAFIG